ncbi:hypothetical protein [Nocardiopsis quinghaiensis]|uniref:hypothetical protein n=1 Tax=Nocardiopsis quinghaiensis TaxID=464995 RepID=UPI001238EF2D|nr:hypothetical protein [Nocardiopsis quinghaiensis]
MSTRDRSEALTGDVDCLWFAWTAGDRAVRKARTETETPVIEREPGVTAEAVLPTLRPACFLLSEGESLRWWSAVRGYLGPPLPLPGGDLRVLGLREGDGEGPGVLAADSERLLVHGPRGWSAALGLDSAPLVLAWQSRRRRALVVTESGTVHQYDPGSGHTETVEPPSPRRYLHGAYDEILGGIWLVPADSPGTACFVRAEPWPPTPVYEVDLPAVATGLGVSHSGEWLIVYTGDRPAAWLYNVNGARSFEAPRGMAELSWPGAFTFANHLIAVDRDTAEAVEIPARADIRAPGGELDIDVFWEARPRMHRASKANRT